MDVKGYLGTYVCRWRVSLVLHHVARHHAVKVGINPGTDVMIFKIFSPKKIAKKLAFLTQNKAKLCKILIITLVLEKNANFSAKIG
jgi:hypothetical protein